MTVLLEKLIGRLDEIIRLLRSQNEIVRQQTNLVQAISRLEDRVVTMAEQLEQLRGRE